MLDTFQCDLMQIPSRLVKYEKLYIFLALDVVSRYLFYYFIKTKNEKDITLAFKKVILQIRRKQKQTPLVLQNSHLTFYGDSGQEFQFRNLKNVELQKLQASLFNSGIPRVKKLGNVERVIR